MPTQARRQISTAENARTMRDSRANRGIKMGALKTGHSKLRDGVVEVVAVTGWAGMVATRRAASSFHRLALGGSQ